MSAEKHPYIPAQYNRLMPYLIVAGADGFIRFVTDVLGAEEQARHMRDETVVQHAEVRIGNSVLMVADAIEDYPPMTAGLFVYVADVDAALTRALLHGAVVVEPVSERPYGRTCGIRDKWGNTWWITTDTSGQQ